MLLTGSKGPQPTSNTSTSGSSSCIIVSDPSNIVNIDNDNGNVNNGNDNIDNGSININDNETSIINKFNDSSDTNITCSNIDTATSSSGNVTTGGSVT